MSAFGGKADIRLSDSLPTRVSSERPRLKAFCRVAPSVLYKVRAMLAARVLLPASRFNVRMSLADHDRLFIDLLHRLNYLKASSGRGYADLNGNERKHRVRVRNGVYAAMLSNQMKGSSMSGYWTYRLHRS